MSYEEFLRSRLFEPLGMKDTTFYPNKRQLARLAKSYKPNAAGTDLEETPITQLQNPLSDAARHCPFPAGGLFSTASDMARFARMIMNKGTLGGRRYLTEVAVKQMTTRQAPPSVNSSINGFGWATGEHSCSHGGAHGTNMKIDWGEGIITIYMIQLTGCPWDANKGLERFERAADDNTAGIS